MANSITWPVRTAVCVTFLVVFAACGGDNGSSGQQSIVLFSPEGQDLNAYDVSNGNLRQAVISGNEEEADPVLPSVNGQVCFNSSRQFVLGDDAGEPNPPPGWGIFQLFGDRVGEFSVAQIARLIPSYIGGPEAGDNYGCGFLPDGRLLLTDIGEKVTGPGTGQLTIWFPPFHLIPSENHYCKIDNAIATAGGIYIDDQERIYVASARNDAGIYRYTGALPTSDDAAGGCGGVDELGAPFVDPGRITKELFIVGGDTNIPSPNAVVSSGHGTFYVSSVINGVIAEYDASGKFVRRILEPPAGEMLGPQPYSTGTPLGIGVDSQGTLYYADLGLVVTPGNIGPGDHTGTVRRIRFENGQPLAPEIIDQGLRFPDGIGILEQ